MQEKLDNRTKQTIVVSDLHASCGPLDDFDPELETHFLSFLQQRSSDPATELVINGDFLDFVQAPPAWGSELESETTGGIPLCFNETQSLDRLDAIAYAHRDVFQGIASFLAANPEHRFTIMPGNHDADFFWRQVQERVLSKLGPQCHVFLDPVYRPPAAPDVWIEHGHQYDPVNRFYVGDQPVWEASKRPILTDKLGRERLLECVGTRALIRFLNKLDASYPFVDNVKPFTRFVKLFVASSIVPGFGPVKVLLILWDLFRHIPNREDYLQLHMENVDTPALIAKLVELPSIGNGDFARKLRDHGVELDMSIKMLLERPDRREETLKLIADHADVLEEEESLLSLKAGFRTDESADLIAAAERIHAQSSPRAIVMGHTHEYREVRRNGMIYFNTGSWTRYYQYLPAESNNTWAVLKNGTYRDFPYQLRYARFTRDCAEMCLFEERPK